MGALRNGPNLFITLDKYWPDGEPAQPDIDRMFLRRARPYSTFNVGAAGVDERVWTTFGRTDPSEQIDLDWHSPLFGELIAGFLDEFSRHGVKIVRLDARWLPCQESSVPAASSSSPRSTSSWRGSPTSLGARASRSLPEVHAQPAIQRRLFGAWLLDLRLHPSVHDPRCLDHPVSRAAPVLLAGAFTRGRSRCSTAMTAFR